MKKLISVLLVALLVMSSLTGCFRVGKPKDHTIRPSESSVQESGETVDVLDFKTIQDVYDAADIYGIIEDMQDGSHYNYYIIGFNLNGKVYRVVADISDIYDAYWDAVFAEDSEGRVRELVGPLEICRYEDLSQLFMTKEEMAACAGLTGEDLLNMGWTVWGYYNDDMTALMEDRAAGYEVRFEGTPGEMTDDYDMGPVIAPLVVTEVVPNGYGDLINLDYTGEVIGGESELNLVQEYEGEEAGGWVHPSYVYITDEEMTALNEILQKTEDDYTYEPLALLGLNVFEGVDYCYLMRVYDDVNGTNPFYAFVYIYEADGVEPYIYCVQPIEPGYLYGNDGSMTMWDMAIDAPAENMTGGWYMALDDTDAFQVFNALNLEGLAYYYCLSEQVVAGTNYCFFAATEDGSPYFVYAYEDLSGAVELVNVELIDPGMFLEIDNF